MSGYMCNVAQAISPVCAYCGTSIPNGVHASSCPYSAGPAASEKSAPLAPAFNPAADLQAMIVGSIFQGLVTALFTQPSSSADSTQAEQKRAEALAAQYLAQKKAREAAEQAAYEKLMKSYKLLSGSHKIGFKTLSKTKIGFKTLESDTESLAASARKPFDTAEESGDSTSSYAGSGGTSFFGDTMPLVDIQFLVNPENDPNVIDLRNAVTYVVDNLKEDNEKMTEATQDAEESSHGQPIVTPPDCQKLKQRLAAYVVQRQNFHKTVLQAQEQLTIWENANRNALVNAAKDGVEYFAGAYLATLAKRGDNADKVRQILEKNKASMARDGLDVKKIEAVILRVKNESLAGKSAWAANTGNDWQTFLKDGVSGLVAQLSNTNAEIKEMMSDSRMQKYFTTDSPELNALYDISKIAADSKVFGKWAAKKVPIIALIEISYKQTYNAADWLLSFQRISEANRINGEVTNSARSLQRNIEETYETLQQCN